MGNIKLIAGVVVLLAAAILVLSSTYIVRETEQALVLRFSKPHGAPKTQPGLYLKAPIVDTVLYFDKRVLDYDANVEEILTEDQKRILVDAFARFRITNVLNFYQAVRNENGLEGRLSSTISSNLRQVLGQTSMANMLTSQRAELMSAIESLVNQEAAQYGIEVIDVRIKRMDLPVENSNAIFAQMRTQREQEARKIRAEGERDAKRLRAEGEKQARVIIADGERQSQILKGEGEAEAERIYITAYSQDTEFFKFYRAMQAMRKGLDSERTNMVLPPQGEFFRYFDSLHGDSGAMASGSTSGTGSSLGQLPTAQ